MDASITAIRQLQNFARRVLDPFENLISSIVAPPFERDVMCSAHP